MFSISLSRRERDRVRGSIVPFRTVYRLVFPLTAYLVSEVTSPFLAQVLEMANHQDVIVPAGRSPLQADEGWSPTKGDMMESLLVSLSLLSGLCFVFFGLKS